MRTKRPSLLGFYEVSATRRTIKLSHPGLLTLLTTYVPCAIQDLSQTEVPELPALRKENTLRPCNAL